MNYRLGLVVGFLFSMVSTPLLSADYYWVGNRGNWSDLSHWATTSGGNINHTALPTANDNVIIDENSFIATAREDIIIDQNNVFCNDLTVTGGQFINFIGTNRNVHIYGNCDFRRSNGEGAFEGTFTFHAHDTDVRTVHLLDYHLRNFIFDDPRGNWSVNGALLIDNLLAIRDGHVTFEETLFVQPLRIEFSARSNGSAILKCDISMAATDNASPTNFFTAVLIDLTNFDFETPPAFPNAGFSIIVTRTAIQFITAGKTARINKLYFFGADDPFGFNYVQLNAQGEGSVSIGNGNFVPNAYINGFVDFDNLTLQSNRTYYWESDKDYNIQNLNAIGNCTETIRLFGSENGMAANFLNTGIGSINGQFLQIRDLHTNNDIFEVFHSQDLGNTDGWVINESEMDFLGGDFSICAGDFIELNPFPFDNNYSLEWSDGSSHSTITISDTGTIWLNATITPECILSDTLTVSQLPLFHLGADTVLCDADTMILDASIPNATYVWQDGTTLSDYKVIEAGIYSVSVTAENCVQSDTIHIDYLKANIITDESASICEGDTVLLIASPYANAQLAWQDGSNTENFEATTSGTYTLRLRNNYCTSTDSITLNFDSKPNIELGEDAQFCKGDSILLDVTFQNPTYNWQDGHQEATYLVKESGTYHVEINNNECILHDSITLDFVNRPTIALPLDTSICVGERLLLDYPTSNTTEVIWADGQTGFDIMVSQSGNYNFTAFNQSCAVTDSIQITISSPPNIDLGPDQTLCDGTTAFFEFDFADVIYLWNDGSMNNSKTIDEAGTYWIEASTDGCTTRDSVTIQYFNNEMISLGNDTMICVGDSLILDFSGLSTNYLWHDGSTSPINIIRDPEIVWLESGQSQCTVRDSIYVDFYDPPTLQLGSDTTTCADQITLQTALMPYQTIVWNDGTTDDALIVFESGIYSAALISFGCPSTDSITVTFEEPPLLTIGADTTICEGEPYILRPDISGTNYRWQDGSSASFLEIMTGGIYSLSLDVNGCTVEDEVEITSISCLLYQIFIPSAFSPNGDGSNDTFFPQFSPELIIESFQMDVYDRWGNLLFQSTSPDEVWDGTYHGSPLGIGSYVYIMDIDYIDYQGPGYRTEKGTVEIVR